MRQEEFLKIFQEALAGKISDRIIQENANYYRVYIKNEIASGKTEEEVLQLLGDPRLLAKTIEESNKFEITMKATRQIIMDGVFREIMKGMIHRHIVQISERFLKCVVGFL